MASIPVRRTPHQRSPYVVRLKRQSAPAVTEISKHEPVAAIKRVEEEDKEAEWKKEVERLRREVAPRKGAKRIAVNFLEQHRRPWLSRSRRQKEPASGGKAPRVRDARPFTIRALRGAGRWIFEFALSIPLGILLFLHLTVRVVEYGGGLLSHGLKRAAHGAGFVLEHTILSAIALAKGVLLVPIKLFIVAAALSYRVLGIVGIGASRSARTMVDVASVMGRALAHPPRHFLRNLLGAGFAAVLLVLPVKYMHEEGPALASLKGRVLGSAQEGFALLGSANSTVATGELSAAGNSLAGAEEKFREARASIDSTGSVIRSLIQLTPEGGAGLHLITAGEELSQAGALLSGALAPLLSPEADTSVVANIRSVSQTLSKALPHLSAAGSALASVDAAVVPEEYRNTFIQAKAALPPVERAVVDFVSLGDTLISALGGNAPKRYAVLFQNNNEIRPAGGFIGSLAIVDVDQGRITRMEIPGGGSYDFQGYLTENVIAPKPLSLINPRWELQDANWYPDWPTSAEKVGWFLEKAGHSSVDGVIAVQASTLKELLALLGPITFEEEAVTLTAENVIDEMQRAVELEYDKEENKPKQYIAELTPRVLDKLLSAKASQFLELTALAQSEIFRKNILLYFRDAAIQKEFESRKWSPVMLSSEMDYLSVVHANIGGGKTDGVIEESWNQEITIGDDGAAEAKLTVVRFHGGDETHIFENVNNVDFMRVYAPAGSEFVSTSGFKPPKPELFESPAPYYTQDEGLAAIEGKVFVDEATSTRINNEFGKTVFGNWTQTMPGETTLATVKYKLPFKVHPFDLLNPEAKGGYSLLIQKQPGAKPVFFSITLRYPAEWGIEWKKTAGGGTIRETGAGLLMFEGVLAKDTGFGVLFKNKE